MKRMMLASDLLAEVGQGEASDEYALESVLFTCNYIARVYIHAHTPQHCTHIDQIQTESVD